MLIVLTGPESTAKTSLALTLSEHFSVPVVQEVARQYLAGRAGYGPADLLRMAQLQQEAEQEAAGEFVIADTDLQVLYIWWQEKYGPAPSWLAHAYTDLGPRHYLLCLPDLAWEDDLLRENPHDRERLVELYRADLQSRGLPFSEIRGQGEARVRSAIEAVAQVIGG